MSNRNAHAGPTTNSVLDAATTAVAFDPANTSPTVVRIGCNRAFYVLVSSTFTAANQTNGMLVMTGCEYVRVNVGETVSVISITGETAGVVTFTDQKVG